MPSVLKQSGCLSNSLTISSISSYISKALLFLNINYVYQIQNTSLGMPRYISPHDGAELFYRDYVPAAVPHPFKANPGTASIHPKPVLVFLHGWPMSSRMWEQLLVPLCETYRFRCIAPDRRGFGSSDWNGARPTQTDINYNTFADDVAHLLDSLDVHSFVFVAASMGCGEGLYARARSHHVQEYCKVIGAVGPFLCQRF